MDFYYQDVQIVSYQSTSLSIVMTMIIYMYQLCINVVYVVMHTFVCTGNGTDELENIVVTGVVDGKCGSWKVHRNHQELLRLAKNRDIWGHVVDIAFEVFRYDT